VTNGKEEAVPIARLWGGDGEQTVGWVYLWNTCELSILWINPKLPAKYIDPPLNPETLARAKAVTSDAITDLLEALSTGGRTNSE
jgi:hypothetical protein